MVDNVAITAGTGTTIAADDIGAGVLVQRTKTTWGPDGTANDVDVATGKPMPIQARHSDGTILSDATGMKISTAQLAALNTTAQAMAAGFQSTDPPTDGTFALRTGSLTETAPVSDTASSGLNGRLQRIAQNITTLIAATLKVALQAATSGGLSRSRTLIPNNTTAIVVKSGAGQLYKIRATNNSATIAYIKLYDATSATAGSGTPVDTIMIPANASGAGIVDTTDVGTVHATGITYTVTTGIADADTGAPAANAYVVTMFYK